MSNEVIKQCYGLKLPVPTKFVLFILADHANDEFLAWPSLSLIAARTCLSERAVRYALRELEEARIIDTQKRVGHSSVYKILPRGAHRAPAPRAPAHSAPSPAPHAPGGAPHAPAVGHHVPPEPSVEPSLNPQEPARVRATPAINIASTPTATPNPEPEKPNPQRVQAYIAGLRQAITSPKARRPETTPEPAADPAVEAAHADAAVPQVPE